MVHLVIAAFDELSPDCDLTVDELRAQVEPLRAAAESRDIIGMAKGLLMAKQEISDDDAFEVLRRASQRENRKVRDLAAEIVATHHRRLRE